MNEKYLIKKLTKDFNFCKKIVLFYFRYLFKILIVFSELV